MIREKQDGIDPLTGINTTDKMWTFIDGTFGSTEKIALRITDGTGKVQMPLGHASASPMFEDWDKAAADGGAGTAFTEHAFWRAAQTCKVISVYFVPDAALTANASNNATLTLARRNADGTNQQTIASITTSTTNWVQFVPVQLTLTAANASLLVGQTLTFTITKGGTGVVVPAGRLVVAYALT